MVQLHVKRGDDSQFLFSTSVDTSLDTLIQQITAIYNGRLKVERICLGKYQRVLFCTLLKSRIRSLGCIKTYSLFLMNLQKLKSWQILVSHCLPTCKASQKSRLWN